MDHARPIILLSGCIAGESCRHDGSSASSPTVRMLSDYADFIPLCPEMSIGLGVPRSPLRLVRLPEGVRILSTGSAEDLTGKIREWAHAALEDIPCPDGIILKGRSPSCGHGDVPLYGSTTGSEPLETDGTGIFAEMVLSRFPLAPFETEIKLEGDDTREHFLTSIFAAADLRRMNSHRNRGLLQEFHARHKLLLMAWNEKTLRELGPLAADATLPVEEVLDIYGEKFLQALKCHPSHGSHVNVLQHVMGFFSKGMTDGDRSLFMDTLEGYRAGTLPLSECLSMVRRFIDEHEIGYLADQAYIEPYPRGLDIPADR